MRSFVREVVEGESTAVTLGHLAFKATDADATLGSVTGFGFFLLLRPCTDLVNLPVKILLEILSLRSTLSSPMRFILDDLFYWCLFLFHRSPLPLS